MSSADHQCPEMPTKFALSGNLHLSTHPLGAASRQMGMARMFHPDRRDPDELPRGMKTDARFQARRRGMASGINVSPAWVPA